jgi:hypothetical protein
MVSTLYLRAALWNLRGTLENEGETLIWRGPPALLSAGDREVLGRARGAIIEVLRGDAEAEGICTSKPPDQPDQEDSGDPPSGTGLVEAGPYAGFLIPTSIPRPDPLRAATALLEALRWRLETHRRDQLRRENEIRRCPGGMRRKV